MTDLPAVNEYLDSLFQPVFNEESNTSSDEDDTMITDIDSFVVPDEEAMPQIQAGENESSLLPTFIPPLLPQSMAQDNPNQSPLLSILQPTPPPPPPPPPPLPPSIPPLPFPKASSKVKPQFPTPPVTVSESFPPSLDQILSSKYFKKVPPPVKAKPSRELIHTTLDTLIPPPPGFGTQDAPVQQFSTEDFHSENLSAHEPSVHKEEKPVKQTGELVKQLSWQIEQKLADAAPLRSKLLKKPSHEKTISFDDESRLILRAGSFEIPPPPNFSGRSDSSKRHSSIAYLQRRRAQISRNSGGFGGIETADPINDAPLYSSNKFEALPFANSDCITYKEPKWSMCLRKEVNCAV